jgi:hypothetical protein
MRNVGRVAARGTRGSTLQPTATIERPHDPTAASPAGEVYRERRARFGAERDRLERRLRVISYVRLGAFGAALAVATWALLIGVPQLMGGAALLLLAFVGLVFYHAGVARQHRRYAMLARLNDEALRRLARDWASLPVRPSPAEAATHPFATDLDLFGRASLAQLLGTVSTPVGEATLHRWLLHPADPATIRERQAAVVELAPLRDLRDELAARGRLMGENPPSLEPFLEWAESEPWLVRRPWLVWLARGLGVATCLLLVAWVAGWMTSPIWLVLALANLGLSYTLGKEVDARLDHVMTRFGALEHYADLFAVLGEASLRTPLLCRLQAELASGELGAQRQTRSLVRRVQLGFIRMWMFYIIIQGLTLWSFHVLALLEAWQQASGRRVRDWLAALGEVEALAALASLAHDHPNWALPEIGEAGPLVYEAREIGHPLLPDDARVTNDVALGPPGTFLLVTGSNMSGKSTLLRSIGVNAVLAQAGGPVCAAALRLPPVTLGTSIRVQDSLEQGVSYFMAELQRLKEVVDAAVLAREDGGGRTLLFLLDEILHGTNTAERQVAARRVIQYLVAHGAIGAVSTHDLTLAASPELAEAAHPIHFTESFHTGPSGPSMAFDYQVHEGIATSTNALKLMQLVGLTLEDDVWQ